MEGEVGRRARPLWRRTPLLRVRGPRELWVKAEGLQRTGSFKVRGAACRLAALGPEAGKGIVTASAGNHGLGVAEAARAFGLEATVFVSEMAPEVKRAGIARLGAELVVAGARYDEAAKRAAEAAASGRTLIRAFDDEYVMAGNGGTIGVEIGEDVPGGLGEGDLVVVPIGGGGLASGVAGALAGSGARARMVGVEPETNHAMLDSFERGQAYTDYPQGGPTLAEGLEGAVSERTYRICREACEAIVTVSEEAIRSAMAWAYRNAGLVLEPSAATAIAAVLEGAVEPARRTVCVTTGSNVDLGLLDEVLAET